MVLSSFRQPQLKHSSTSIRPLSELSYLRADTVDPQMGQGVNTRGAS